MLLSADSKYASAGYCDGEMRRQLSLTIPWAGIQAPSIAAGKTIAEVTDWQAFCGTLAAQLADLAYVDASAALQRCLNARITLPAVLSLRLQPSEIASALHFLDISLTNILRTLASGMQHDVAEQMFYAAISEEIDPDLLPKGFFSKLSTGQRSTVLSLFEGLRTGAGMSNRLQWVRTEVLLSEEHEIAMAMLAWQYNLWEEVDAVRLLERLLLSTDYHSPTPRVIIKAILHNTPDCKKSALLRRALNYCDAHAPAETSRDIILSLFISTLAAPFAREWLAGIDDPHQRLHEESLLITRVFCDERRGRSLLFFLDWEMYPQAIELAKGYWRNMDDVESWQLRDASRRLECRAADAALLLYKSSCNDFDDLKDRASIAASSRRIPWHSDWTSSA